MDIINPHRFSTAAPTVDFDSFGNASRSFNGVDSQVTVEDNADLPTGAQTWACWVKLNSTGVNQDLMAHWAADTNEASILFRITTADKINFAIANDPSGSPFGNTQTVSTGTLNSGQWYHIAVTFDPSNTVKIYINGSLDITRTSGVLPAVYDSSAPLTFGNRIDRTFVLDGNLCDCRIYDAALDATKIANLYGGENITTNLIGHWLKDTPSLLDHSGTNDGTNEGSAFAYDNPSPAVEFGKASRVFDGVNDYIDLGDSNDFSFGDGAGNDSPFSISAWVKLDTTTNTRAIIGKYAAPNGEWLLWYNGSNNEFRFSVYSQSGMAWIRAKSSLTINANQWYHVVGAYDGSKSSSGMKIYVDGSLDTTNDAGGGYSYMTNTTTPVIIGQYSSTAFFEGNIADVRLYNSELSSTDIAAIYGGENITTNLVGHWLTNTDDVKDYAGVNDGTNNGSTYSFDNPLGSSEFGSASRSFNGTSDLIDVPDLTSTLGTSYTFSVWAKLDSLTTNGSCFFDIADSTVSTTSVMARIFYYNPSGQIQCYIRDAAGNINTVAYSWTATGSWHHFVGKRTGSTIELFIDGVSVGSDSTNTLGAHTSAHYTTIGNIRNAVAPSGAPYWMHGNLADVRIYDAALNATDIFNLSRGYDYRTNLIGQWLTNKDDVDDYAGTNHGTNNGSTYSQDAPL